LKVESTGGGNQALIDKNAQVTVDGDAEILSGNEATLGKQAMVTVTHNLRIDAAKCQISSSAVVTAGAKSGSCL
jgi:hypothetical protein